MMVISMSPNRINPSTLTNERKKMFLFDLLIVCITSMLVGLFQLIKFIIILPVTLIIFIVFYFIELFEGCDNIFKKKGCEDEYN